MTYVIKYNDGKRDERWAVCLDVPKGDDIPQAYFDRYRDAQRWITAKQEDDGSVAEKFISHDQPDRIGRASEDSFPASDPPGWTKTTAAPTAGTVTDMQKS